ncbi:hypothetical protein BD779DRAFT_1471487 [Infundibulicybe gibba]|nr:hypothetical protein BD779DRAFT_1471487 [Infundibulicybe gibba]
MKVYQWVRNSDWSCVGYMYRACLTTAVILGGIRALAAWVTGPISEGIDPWAPANEWGFSAPRRETHPPPSSIYVIRPHRWGLPTFATSCGLDGGNSSVDIRGCGDRGWIVSVLSEKTIGSACGSRWAVDFLQVGVTFHVEIGISTVASAMVFQQLSIHSGIKLHTQGSGTGFFAQEIFGGQAEGKVMELGVMAYFGRDSTRDQYLYLKPREVLRDAGSRVPRVSPRSNGTHEDLLDGEDEEYDAEEEGSDIGGKDEEITGPSPPLQDTTVGNGTSPTPAGEYLSPILGPPTAAGLTDKPDNLVRSSLPIERESHVTTPNALNEPAAPPQAEPITADSYFDLCGEARNDARVVVDEPGDLSQPMDLAGSSPSIEPESHVMTPNAPNEPAFPPQAKHIATDSYFDPLRDWDSVEAVALPQTPEWKKVVIPNDRGASDRSRTPEGGIPPDTRAEDTRGLGQRRDGGTPPDARVEDIRGLGFWSLAHDEGDGKIPITTPITKVPDNAGQLRRLLRLKALMASILGQGASRRQIQSSQVPEQGKARGDRSRVGWVTPFWVDSRPDNLYQQDSREPPGGTSNDMCGFETR